MEKWIEREMASADRTIIVGDFNRNFWHEVKDTGPVRTDASDPTEPLPAGVLANSFFEEVFDGMPVETEVTMLRELCPANEIAALVCAEGEVRKLEPPEAELLRYKTYLGCRNHIGLDHMLIGPGITAEGDAVHVSIGRFGANLPANNENPEPLLAVAYHCPLVAHLKL